MELVVHFAILVVLLVLSGFFSGAETALTSLGRHRTTSLIEEDPGGREHHFRKVGQIYAAMGNEREARRYRLFADKLGEPLAD